MRRLAQGAGVVACLSVLLQPFYFVIYRLMVFETVPRDDYAPFLLWLLGQSGGQIPPSPYGYRILSVVAAAPFYFALPGISPSNISAAISAPYLQATAAIAALSYLSLITASATVYFLAVDRAHLKPLEGACAGALMFVFGWYASIVCIDTVAILLICIGLHVMHRRMTFGVLVIASVACNEKVAIVFALWLTTRWVLCREDRPALLAPWLTSLAAIAAYLAIISIVQLPGNHYQLRPEMYPLTLWENLALLPTPRGLLLNIFPVMILSGVALSSWKAIGAKVVKSLFRPVDIIVIFEMALVSMVVTHQFQMGRIAMHAAALYVLPAGLALGRILRATRAESVPAHDIFSDMMPSFEGARGLVRKRAADVTHDAEAAPEPAAFKRAASG